MPRINRKLTETEIRNAKPKDKDYKLYDDGGLRLLVRTSGTKVWQYPYKLQDKYNIYTIGQYPDIGSADARKLRDEARKLIKDGIAPNEQKKAIALKAQYESRNSFHALATEWHSKQLWAKKHAASILRRLEVDVFPEIGHKPIAKVTRLDVLQALQKIEKRGSLDVAKRVNQYCASIFDYALVLGLCEMNLAIGLSKAIKAHQTTHRAYLKEKELPDFLAKLEAYRGRTLIRLALKLLVHTFVRPGELRGARWDEIEEAKSEWRIVPERMKMKREHIVPLSSQALGIIRQIRAISGGCALLFPGVKSIHKPISDVTLLKAIQILGYGGKATPHGMRATASTILNENGFKPDVIERQLAHIEQNKVRAAYHHAEYLAERREMMQWWGNYLESMS
jgi:integrase